MATPPLIPDAAVRAYRNGAWPMEQFPNEDERVRAGLAAALPLLRDNAFKIACDISETNHGLIELNEKLLAVARATHKVDLCEDFGEMPTYCETCRAENMEAYQAKRRALYEALADPVVVELLK